MLLSDLLAKTTHLGVVNFKQKEVLDIVSDSRKCKPGSIFASLGGANFRAGEFISDAKKNGAVAVLTDDSSFASKITENAIICDNARKTMAEIAKCLCTANLENMSLIAVTGTKGKTTTSLCLHHILERSGVCSVSIGTLGCIGKVLPPTESSINTTPESCELYRVLGDAFGAGARVGVIEVSSQALITYRTLGIPFNIGIFTNLSEDHIGYLEHPSYEDYYAAKRSLFRDYGIGLAFLNSRDGMAKHIAKGVPERVFVLPEYLPPKREGFSSFSLDGKSYEVYGGSYNSDNAALAVSAARRAFGIDERIIADALSTFRAEGRFESYSYRGARIFIDYAHNADSVRAVLASVRAFTKGKIIAVIGSVGNRSENRRASLGEVCERYADITVISSDNPDFESPEAIAAEIHSAFKDKSKATVITDRADAIIHAVSLSRSSDSVVLLGKGHERFQLVRGERLPFSERALILAMGATEN